jgi:hypothetical protein
VGRQIKTTVKKPWDSSNLIALRANDMLMKHIPALLSQIIVLAGSSGLLTTVGEEWSFYHILYSCSVFFLNTVFSKKPEGN